MKFKKITAAILIVATALLFAGCVTDDTTSTSGVKKATADVKVQSNGLTVEQNNIKDRFEMDNLPGAIRHLYVISPYSGQVIIYSTVKGKVTSSGKRLTSNEVEYRVMGQGANPLGPRIGDDGTYGSSGSYLYWWDTKGVYHQHYLGNEILHIADQPMRFDAIITEQAVYEDE